MAQPKSDRDEFDGGEEVFRPFVVPGRKAAELFELVKEALHQVPLTIEPLAEGWFFSGVTARRNVRPASLAVDLYSKALAVVGLVRKQDAGGLDSFEQGLASRFRFWWPVFARNPLGHLACTFELLNSLCFDALQP